MNERGDVKGYLRVAVQAVLGREEETVNLPLRPISIFFLRWITHWVSVSLPGLPSRTRVLAGRKSKEGKVRTSPQAPCTAPNQSTRLETYYFPKYPT